MAPQAKPHEIDCFLSTLWIQWMDWHYASQTYSGMLQWQVGLILAKFAAKISFWKNLRQISMATNDSTSHQTTWNRLFPLHSMDPMDGLTLCFPDILSRDAAVTSGTHFGQFAAKISFWKNWTQISMATSDSTSQTTWNRLLPLHSMDPNNGLTCFPDISRAAAVTNGAHSCQIWSQNQLL